MLSQCGLPRRSLKNGCDSVYLTSFLGGQSVDNAKIEPYAAVILKLLREVVSTDDQKEWKLLLEHNYAIQEYFNRIGLEMYVNTDDGYAYLQQPSIDEGN